MQPRLCVRPSLRAPAPVSLSVSKTKLGLAGPPRRRSRHAPVGRLRPVRHRWHVRLRPGDEVRCRTYCQGKLMLPAQQFVLHHTCLRTHRLAIGISMHWEYRSSVLRGGVILCLWKSDASDSSAGPRWASPGFQARFGVWHDLDAQLKSGNGPQTDMSDSVLFVAARRITTVTAWSTMAPRSCTPVPTSCKFSSAMRNPAKG